jgi:hypothetical protein
MLGYVSPMTFEQLWTAAQKQVEKSAYWWLKDYGKQGQDQSLAILLKRCKKFL